MTVGPTPTARAARRFGIPAILAFSAAFLAAVPFGTLIVLVRERVGWLRTIDLRTAEDLHTYDEAHPWFVTTMKVVSDSGSTPAWIGILTIVGLGLVYRRLYRLTAFLTVTAIGSSVLNAVLKNVVGRSRPVFDHPVATATGKSFPSGHTQAAVVGYGILVLVFLPATARRWRPVTIAAAAAMVVLIGFSRVALGVHFVSDVVGALIIGSAWLLAMTAAFSIWPQDHGPAHTHGVLEPLHASTIANTSGPNRASMSPGRVSSWFWSSITSCSSPATVSSVEPPSSMTMPATPSRWLRYGMRGRSSPGARLRVWAAWACAAYCTAVLMVVASRAVMVWPLGRNG